MQVCSLHRRIRKRSVNVLALPNHRHTHTHTHTHREGFLDTQVCRSPIFVFSVRGFLNVQETDPTEMHVLLYRIQSSGPDPFKLRKLDPHKYILHRRTLMMLLFPLYLIVVFCFSHCIMHEVLKYLLFVFDLMMFT